MELFVVNRHEGDEIKVQENEEKNNLNKILKKIERNKKLRQKQKDKLSKIKEIKQKTLESREIKRKIKASIVPVPENTINEFIEIPKENDTNKTENAENGDESKTKRTKIDLETLGFTVLGAQNNANKVKVKRVLPAWLTNPTVISVNLQKLETKVSDIKVLDKGLRKLLKVNNIKYFFPVQAEVIPWLITSSKHSDVVFPRDICVSAPTGSGKTLAYVLPIVQALKKYSVKKIRALIILPTQDLANQVFKTFKIYSQQTNIDICLITGNNSFATEQTQLITDNKAFGCVSKVDILVCTAGRLVDHLKMTKGFNLKYLEFLVIDEADRVLDNIQNDWLYHLEKHIYQEDNSGKILNLYSFEKPRAPQKLLFSATLSQDPEKLQQLSLFQPKLFTSVVENTETNVEEATGTFIGKYTTPNELTEKYIITNLELKPLFLYKFIKTEKLTKSIVFTHSVESAHRLTILLKALFKEDLRVEEISSNLDGKNRNRLIDSFSTGNIDLLVCTDALARGIDLPNVQCVISYSAPKYLKTYIHRAGRTARAGESGLAVTMLNKTQIGSFKKMLSQAGKNDLEELVIPEDDLEPLGEQYKESLLQLKNIVEIEEKQDLVKSISAKRSIKVKRKRKDSVNSVISK